jgi:dienelactone hydrolase
MNHMTPHPEAQHAAQETPSNLVGDGSVGHHEIERLELQSGVVPALLIRPAGSGPHPAAVLQHGYGSRKEDLLPLATELAAHGFVVLLADAWGHGERLPTHGPTWMTELSADYFFTVTRNTADDVIAALNLLECRPEVRPDQKVVGGFSMGAIVALLVGTEDERAAGVVSLAGSPLPDLLSVSIYGSKLAGPESRHYALDHDAADAEHLRRLAPKPLLISHGQRDDMVPVAGALRLYQSARPYYATYPDRLALKLYDHTHVVGEQQMYDALEWMTPYFQAISG